MKIRDIVNREIVNLTNCEHEPIHIPGSIQPHGFLLALKKESTVIDFCSANVAEFTDWRHEQLLGKKLEEVFGESDGQTIVSYAASKTDSLTPPLSFRIKDVAYSVSVNNLKGNIIIEFEPHDSAAQVHADFYDQTRQFVGYMEKAASLQALCQRVAEQTRTITGYDRVMIYRFDKDYNGEVFGEAKRDDLEPFLGLHYPHTDIPAQARELYKQNLLRLIVDVNYTPVPLFTIDDAPGKNLDLGNSILRSVSPIHVQYLANIGVGATLTISLMHENNLWGLIACHHYSPKYIDRSTRNAAQLQGHFITSQINVRQLAEQHDLARSISVALEQVLNQPFVLQRSAFEGMAKQPELLQICNASGVVIFIKQDLYSNGTVPKEPELRRLIDILKAKSPDGVFVTSNLSEIYEGAEAIRDCAAGVLFHCMNPLLNIGVMWFRGETLMEVKWAGDPNKAIIKDEKGLSPRNSFKLWKEVVKLQSNPWTEPELSAASNFAHSLERQAHMLFISEDENKYRELSHVLKETNAELENINWISTHDLKEPLRKIRLFGSRILDQYGSELADSVVDSIQKMDSSAGRMQKLITDLMSYSRLRQTSDILTDVDLSKVVSTVALQMKEEDADKVKIEVHALPVVKGIPFLLEQLFINLINNSIKFAKADLVPMISILTDERKVPRDQGENKKKYRAVVVRDNGIGFEKQYRESIFNVFSRLHPQTRYSGSGIGLALCKKIMTIHQGLIESDSEDGVGAEFTLYFPAE